MVILSPKLCYTYSMGNGAKRKLNKCKIEKMRGKWLILTAFFSLTSAGIIFAILCLANSQAPFIVRHYGLFVALASAFFFIACGIGIWLTLAHKDIAVKMFFSGYIFLLFCLILILIFQKTGFFKVISSAEGVQEYLERSGAWMPILYILLQYFQVILLPIPSIVSTVAGVALFGAFKTMLFSLIGILLGSITAFFTGRKLGNKAVAWMVGEETLDKWQKKLKGKDNLILTLAFILPLFPDDVLCFIAGLSSMSSRYFLGMMAVTRFVGISATCYSFDFIPWNTWWGLLIWGCLIAGLICAFIFTYKYMDNLQCFFKKIGRNRKNERK